MSLRSIFSVSACLVLSACASAEHAVTSDAGGTAIADSKKDSQELSKTPSAKVVRAQGAPSAIVAYFGDYILQPGHWFEAPNSRLDAVDPCPARNCSYSGTIGIRGVMGAWNGGAYDTIRDRLIVWGGGHRDYGGNELYAFDVNSLQWQRLTDPSTSLSDDTFYYPDGEPSSRHTYDYVEYLPGVDRFCTVGGAALWGSGNGYSSQLDCYSFQNARWEKFGTMPNGVRGIGSITAADGQGNLWAHGTGTTSDRLAKYDAQSNTWTGYASGSLRGRYVATIDTANNKMYAIGLDELLVWDLDNPNSPRQVVSTSGATEIEGTGYAGIAYHTPSGKIVAWDGGSSIYLLDTNTGVWTKETPAATNSVTPSAAEVTGTYGRFRYVPSKDVFIAVNRTKENVFFYKLK